MSAENTCLTIFAKAPERGQVKTRLAQQLGDDLALEIYHELLAITADVCEQWPGPVIVCSTGDPHHMAESPLGGFNQIEQVNGNLGDRLHAGLTTTQQRYGQAIAIGTDCPDLQLAELSVIAELLTTNDLAIGPSDDGGYWCLGVRSPQGINCTCASDLPWSQDTLLDTTRCRAHQAQLRLALGSQLNDVDTVDDWQRAVAAGLMSPRSLPAA